MTGSKYHNGAFCVHGVLGDYRGKASGYFSPAGVLRDAEFINRDRVRPVQPNGPAWRHIQAIGATFGVARLGCDFSRQPA